MARVRHERIAGAILLLGIVYLVFEFLTASVWQPPYDWARNYISDLGFSDCATVDGDYLCSPLHPLMNAGFLVQGTVFTVGGVLVVRLVFGPGWRRRIVGTLLAASGLGTFSVGIAHQSLALYAAGLNGIHVAAATVAIGAGDIGITVLGLLLLRDPEWRGYGAAILVIGLIGTVGGILLLAEADLGIGLGAVERLAVYPLNTWTIGTGVGLLVKSARDAVVARAAEGFSPARTT